MSHFTIGKLATASETSVDTIRFYEREGLLPPATRSAAGYRQYQAQDAQRLRFIRRAKQLGFSLEDIRLLLSLSDSDGPSAEIKRLTQIKLDMIQDKIADLQKVQTALQQLSDSCDGQGCAHDCPIIDALSDSQEIQA